MKRILHVHARVWNKGDHGLALAIQQLLRKKLGSVQFKDYDIKKLKTSGFEKVAALASKYDAIVIGGGGLYGKWLFPVNSKPLHKVVIPIILYSIGYDHTVHNSDLAKAGWKSIAELNSIAAVSSVRDNLSLKKLQSHGIKGAMLVPDPGMFLASKKTPLPLKKNAMNIGVNIAYHWWMRTAEPSRAIKIPMRKKVLSGVVETCSMLQNSFDAKLFYMPHFYTEKSVLRRLEKKLDIRQLSLSPSEMVYAYGKFSLSLTMNMHSSIFSFNAGTPFINIAYNEKNPAFCSLAGMQSHCLGIDELEKMPSHALQLLSNERSLRKKLAKRKKQLWKKEEAFLEKIAKIIK